MGLLCLIGRHAPGPEPVANAGYRFSRCRRCGHDIVQSATSGWRTPTAGFRVVWRPKDERSAEAARRTAPMATGDFMASGDDGFAWAKTAGAPRQTADLSDFMADVPPGKGEHLLRVRP